MSALGLVIHAISRPFQTAALGRELPLASSKKAVSVDPLQSALHHSNLIFFEMFIDGAFSGVAI